VWVLLSGGLRRWVIFSVAVPVAGRLLGAAGRRLEAAKGPTRVSSGLQGAGRLVSNKARTATAETGAAEAPRRRGLLRRKR